MRASTPGLLSSRGCLHAPQGCLNCGVALSKLQALVVGLHVPVQAHVGQLGQISDKTAGREREGERRARPGSAHCDRPFTEAMHTLEVTCVLTPIPAKRNPIQDSPLDALTRSCRRPAPWC